MSAVVIATKRRPRMLRSTKAMLDYSVVAKDGQMGHVSDIVVDDHTLEVRYVVVDTGERPSGGRVLLADWIRSVHPDRKAIVVNVNKTGFGEPRVAADIPEATDPEPEPERRPLFPSTSSG